MKVFIGVDPGFISYTLCALGCLDNFHEVRVLHAATITVDDFQDTISIKKDLHGWLMGFRGAVYAQFLQPLIQMIPEHTEAVAEIERQFKDILPEMSAFGFQLLLEHGIKTSFMHCEVARRALRCPTGVRSYPAATKMNVRTYLNAQGFFLGNPHQYDAALLALHAYMVRSGNWGAIIKVERDLYVFSNKKAATAKASCTRSSS